jgi:hypothetical protein
MIAGVSQLPCWASMSTGRSAEDAMRILADVMFSRPSVMPCTKVGPRE